MKIPNDDQRCGYTKSDGSRCRMLRAPEQPLCPSHSKRSLKQAAVIRRQQDSLIRGYYQAEAAAMLFPGGRGQLDSARRINRFLSRVARFVAEGRVEPKIGAALCYIGQTLLTTLPHLIRERESSARAHRHPIFSAEQLKFVDRFERMLLESGDAQEDPLPAATVVQIPSRDASGEPSQHDK